MKNKIFELIKMDNDEKTDGQGFVMMDKPEVNQNDPSKTNNNTNYSNTESYETKKENETVEDIKQKFYEKRQEQKPFTEKMDASDDKFFSQFNDEIENKDDLNTNLKKEKGNKKFGKNMLIILLAVILCFGAGFGGGYLAVKNYSGTGSSGDVTINPNSEVNVTAAVADKVLPSVVGITATTTTVNYDMFFGAQEEESGGVGTGIIVDKSGYILTNSHVILDSDQSKLTVLLADGRETTGTVEWFDAGLDLAIVKISATNLTAAELGDSDKIAIGQYAAAIGNPLGLDFQGSVTQGVVSGLDRSITASSGTKEVQMENLIQVDAAINSGNSGGPLLNSEGQVIGINTAKASGEGMGFAIPINTAKPIVEKIKETGEFSRVYMGVSVRDASDMAEEYEHIDLGTKTGAYIESVTKGSPAESAGLKSKDVIVEVDGNKIEDRTDLINLLLKYSAGDTIKVKYYSNGKAATTNVKLTGDVPE